MQRTRTDYKRIVDRIDVNRQIENLRRDAIEQAISKLQRYRVATRFAAIMIVGYTAIDDVLLRKCLAGRQRRSGQIKCSRSGLVNDRINQLSWQIVWISCIQN